MGRHVSYVLVLVSISWMQLGCTTHEEINSRGSVRMLTVDEIHNLPDETKPVWDLMTSAALIGHNESEFRRVLDGAVSKRQIEHGHTVYYFPVREGGDSNEAGTMIYVEVGRRGVILNCGIDETF